MYKFDRLDFPKRYPIPNWLKLSVLVMIFVGIGIHYCSQKQAAESIQISDVEVADFSRVHVEVDYTLVNRSRVNRFVWLHLQVFGVEGDTLGDELFSVSVKAGSRQEMIKVIDKLSRPLSKNEVPTKVKIEIYRKKVLS